VGAEGIVSEPSERSGLRCWLDAADRLVGDDDAFDGHIVSGIGLVLDLDPSVDLATLQRVITALTARRAAVACELADLGRRRVALAHSKRGVAGYLTTP